MFDYQRLVGKFDAQSASCGPLVSLSPLKKRSTLTNYQPAPPVASLSDSEAFFCKYVSMCSLSFWAFQPSWQVQSVGAYQLQSSQARAISKRICAMVHGTRDP